MIFRLFPLALLLLATVAARSASAEENTDLMAAEIARVGDEVITGAAFQRDLQDRVKIEQARQGRIIKPDTAFRRATLRERVNALVLRILVRNANIEVSDAEVQEEYQRHRRTLPGEEDYARYLAERGLNHETVLDEIRARLQTDRFIANETEGIEVTDDELKVVYDKWVEAKMTHRPEPSVTFGHIFVQTLPGMAGENEAARQRAQDALDRLEAGDDFAAVAKEFSDDADAVRFGGIRRDVPISYLPPALSAALGKMEPGELSGPVEGRYGWHVVRMDAIHKVGEASFEELRPRLKDLLLEEKKAEKIKKLLAGAETVVRIEVHEDRAMRIPLVANEPELPSDAS